MLQVAIWCRDNSDCVFSMAFSFGSATNLASDHCWFLATATTGKEIKTKQKTNKNGKGRNKTKQNRNKVRDEGRRKNENRNGKEIKGGKS